jgi:hypothetical protein
MEQNDRIHHRTESRNYVGLPPIRWYRLLGSSVYLLADGRRLGKIEAINSDLVVIKQGCARVTRYYISHSKLRYWVKGNKMWIDLTPAQAVLHVMQVVPNPSIFVTLGSHFPDPPFAFGD